MGSISSTYPSNAEQREFIFCWKQLKALVSSMHAPSSYGVHTNHTLCALTMAKPEKNTDSSTLLKVRPFPIRPSAVQLTQLSCNKIVMGFAHFSFKVRHNSCVTAKPFENDFLATILQALFPSIVRHTLAHNRKNKLKRFSASKNAGMSPNRKLEFICEPRD